MHIHFHIAARSCTHFLTMARISAFVPCAPSAVRALHMPRATCQRPAPRSVAAGGFVARDGVAARGLTDMRHRVAVTTASAKQMDTEWNAVKVLENSVICEEHRYVVLNVGTTAETGSLCDAYRVPGMYLQMRLKEGGKPAFLAISCAPNMQGVFEFLIKDAESTEWVTALKAGDTVEVSPVMGKGFPISSKLELFGYPALPEEQQPTELLMFATGSGIAPIRAAIESRLNGINPMQRKSVKLYYGARYPERMAYMDRFKLWESDKVEVIPVMSQPDKSKDGWSGRTGYIQDVLKADGIPLPAKTGVILCGVKGMCEDVTKICTDAGVPAERILTNF